MAISVRGSTALATFGTSTTAHNPGTAAGDVVVAIFYSDTAIPSQTVNGWTACGATVTTNYSLAAFWRLAGASEPTTWPLPGGSGSSSLIGTIVVTGANTTTPVGAYATSSGASTTSQTAPSVTPTTAGSLLINVFAQQSASATHSTVTGATEAFDTQEGSEISFAADYTVLAGTSATGTKASTASVAGAYDSLSLVINPAAGTDATVVGVVASAAATAPVGTVSAVTPAAFTNTGDGGTDGATVTAANSGGASGNAFGTVTIDGTGTTVTYSSAQTVHGAGEAYKIVVPTSGHASLLAPGGTLGAAPSARFRYYLYLGAMPSATIQHFQTIDNASGTCYLYLTAAGALVLIDAAGATVHTSATTLSLGTWYRIEHVRTTGTTTSNGTLGYAIYAGDSTTALDTFTSTTCNAGTGTLMSNFAVGKVSSAATWVTGNYVDDIAADNGASGWIGPSLANATLAGPVATVAVTAPAGAMPQTLAGPKASVAATAPVGAVLAGSGAAGPKASVAITAPAGSLVKGQTLAGPKGSVAATAPVGVASVKVLGALAAVQARALIGVAGAIVPPTHQPDTATLLGDGTSLVTLASDGTSASTLTNALGTATLAAAVGTATVQ